MSNQNLVKITTLLTLFTALNLASCGKENTHIPASDLEISSGDIVNGKKVTEKNELEQFLVALEIGNSNGDAICTGSIISSNYILTAAHCVDDDPKSIKIIFENDIKKMNTENTRIADKFIQHPNWGKHNRTGEGDLALIHFKGKIPNGHSITKLAANNFKPEQFQKTNLLGYGVTNGLKRSGAGVLRQTKTEIIDQRSDTEYVLDGKTTSVCFGDSGGPAFIKNKNEFFQWGVASSVSNQECNDIAIHTAIMPYTDWINKNIHSRKKN